MIGRRSSRSIWIAARARNAARRVVWIIALGTLAAAVTALALVLVPRAAERQLRERINGLPPAPDSLPYRRAVESARMRQALAVRDTTTLPVLNPVDSTVPRAVIAPPAAVAPIVELVRDSATVELLTRIRRARQLPLVESYRALSNTELLRGDPGARALRDSIDVIVRARDALLAIDSADGRSAALVAEISVLGHALVRVAEQRVSPNGVGADTVVSRRVVALLQQAADSARRDTLARQTVSAESALLAVRRQHAARDSMRAVLEGERRPPSPPYSIALAAIILGMAVGYGAVLVAELRHPTIGDAAEVERLTGAPVLVHSRDTPSMLAERSRWSERPGVPKIIDRASDTYVLLHLALSGVGDAAGDVDVLAADHAIGAAVALGTAAAAAGESRAVLLVEGAGRTPTLADLLRTTARYSAADIRAGLVTAADVVQAVTLDRDARIDVVFAGAGDALVSTLATRYDLRIYLATGGRATAATPHDVIVCARPGATTLAWLSHVMTETKSRQQRVRAVVLWNRERPRR